MLTDDAQIHHEIGPRPFKRYDGHHQYEQEHFWDWAPERNVTTGAVRLTDYHFKKPNQSMEVDRPGGGQYAQGAIGSFDYPGDYLAQDVGRLVAGLRTEQERGADHRNPAVGGCVSLGAGMRMTLSGDNVPGSGETYLCLSASHHFVSEAYGSGGQGSDGYSFTGSYVLMPDTAPMAPPKRTPLAVVQGPQTAEVVGEGEIDCDEYGRILVRFHWDLKNAYSMRCRVSQNWAVAGWGGMVIPRIGMEVLVEFLEGDPDKPVVVGNVFNGKNDAPYPLPAHKTRSTFRTNSHNGKKTGRGFNELRFEDQQGEEELFVHAQRDLHIGVENDARRSVNGNSHDQVSANRTVLTYGESVAHSVSLTAMTSSDSIFIGSGNAPTVIPVSPEAFLTGAADLRDIEHPRRGVNAGRNAERGSTVIHSAADLLLSSDGETLIQSDQSLSVSSIDTLRLTTPANMKLSAQDRLLLEASQGIVLNSPSGIVLQSGSSKLTLSPDGAIRIEGVVVTVKGKQFCIN